MVEEPQSEFRTMLRNLEEKGFVYCTRYTRYKAILSTDATADVNKKHVPSILGSTFSIARRPHPPPC